MTSKNLTRALHSLVDLTPEEMDEVVEAIKAHKQYHEAVEAVTRSGAVPADSRLLRLEPPDLTLDFERAQNINDLLHPPVKIVRESPL